MHRLTVTIYIVCVFICNYTCIVRLQTVYDLCLSKVFGALGVCVRLAIYASFSQMINFQHPNCTCIEHEEYVYTSNVYMYILHRNLYSLEGLSTQCE